MTIPTIFETCRPRADVLRGAITEADFAADLAQVIVGKGNEEYLDPGRFFANTYPTRGLKNLLANVCRRLAGAGGWRWRDCSCSTRRAPGRGRRRLPRSVPSADA